MAIKSQKPQRIERRSAFGRYLWQRSANGHDSAPNPPNVGFRLLKQWLKLPNGLLSPLNVGEVTRTDVARAESRLAAGR